MAYPALVSLAQTTYLILNYHQDFISPQVKDQIVSINKHIIILQAFLEEFPNEANSLEAIIRVVTHVVEDIVEIFMSRRIYEPSHTMLESSVGPLKSKLKHQLEEKSEHIHCDFSDEANRLERRILMWPTEVAQDIIEFFWWEQFRRSLCPPLESSVGPSKSKFKNQLNGQHQLPRYNFHELKEATEEIESIAGIAMKMKNSNTVKDEQRGDHTAVRSSSRVAPADKDAVVGFENDVMEMKSRLCGESSKLEVIPIFGMGGIGKTTLARNVYDDPLIVEYFQIRVWVTVSQDYSLKEIVSGLLISMKVFEAKSESMRAEHVYQNLKGRKYLIVIDDIWSIKAWDDLKTMFPDDGNGSRIILTTRLLDVASYTVPSRPVHLMRLMDKDQSWNLLRQKVFKQNACPLELEYVGKKIVGSCRGLPLAIVVISGILSSIDQTATAWDNIAKNVTSVISANDEQFDKILSLSYTHLPHHLRPCFLYMGGFPEDYEVRASKLIKLWVAEGFLKPNGSNKSFEETAEEYLEDLVKRSLVLVTKRKSDGRIKSLSMHDLMREMCVRIAQKEKFFQHGCVSLHQGINISRRVSIIRSDLHFHENVHGLTIRTILIFGQMPECPFSSVRYFRLLRVLDLLDVFIRALPDEIFELFHLRYLAFNSLFRIRAAISNLLNLQTLIISSHSSYEYLSYCPSNFFPFLLEIWSMPQLRHLVIHSGFYFCLPPLQEGRASCLENLQTLSLAINFICTPEILKTIPNLKKLEISYSACRNHEEEYQLHNLEYLQQLENLKLKMHDEFPSPEKVCPVSLPTTLKKLTLSGLGLSWEEMEVVGSLPNLEVLKLKHYAFDGDTWETAEGEFSQLRFLLIDESELQYWITESSHFPRLECLVLHRCWYLSEIPDGIGEVPTLELIEVDHKYLLDSAKQIQDDQQSCGNDALQVRFVKRKNPI